MKGETTTTRRPATGGRATMSTQIGDVNRVKTRTPKELIAAIKEGDAEAFAAFYMGYADSLIHFMTRITGSTDDAREVTQEVFAVLWERRAALDPHTSLHGFVFGMARNMAFKMVRARLPRDPDPGTIDNLRFEGMADDGIISAQTAMLLQEVIDRMPEQRRRVFLLSRNEELTYNQIALRLGISVNTVRTHMTLALRELRAALALAFLWHIITM